MDNQATRDILAVRDRKFGGELATLKDLMSNWVKRVLVSQSFFFFYHRKERRLYLAIVTLRRMKFHNYAPRLSKTRGGRISFPRCVPIIHKREFSERCYAECLWKTLENFLSTKRKWEAFRSFGTWIFKICRWIRWSSMAQLKNWKFQSHSTLISDTFIVIDSVKILWIQIKKKKKKWIRKLGFARKNK